MMDPSALERCEALRGLTPQERDVIMALGREVSFAAGEQVIEDDTAASGFYILEAGAVEVLKDGRTIARLAPGAVLGEMALFNENVRTSGVRAVEPATLLFIPTAGFVHLVLQQEPAAVKVMETLGQLM